MSGWAPAVMGHTDSEVVAVDRETLRRLALNLLRRERTSKGGVRAHRWRAGRDEAYLRTVLARS